MKEYIKYFIRIALFAIVCIFLTRKLTNFPLHNLFSGAQVYLLLIALIFYYLKVSLQGLRWQTACRAHGKNISPAELVKRQIEIAFLEILFPFPDSEDVIKVIFLDKLGVSLSVGTAIVIYDRIIGVIVLLIILPFSATVFSKIFFHTGFSNLIVIICLPLLIAAIVFYRKIIKAFLKIIPNSFKGKSLFLAEFDAIMTSKIAFSWILKSLLLTSLFALCSATVPWLLINSLGSHVSFFILLISIPLFYVSAILPLSIQGLGLYEATLVFVLQYTGIPTEICVKAGIIHFIFHLIIIVSGGIIFLFDREKNWIENAINKYFNKPLGKSSNYTKDEPGGTSQL